MIHTTIKPKHPIKLTMQLPTSDENDDRDKVKREETRDSKFSWTSSSSRESEEEMQQKSDTLSSTSTSSEEDSDGERKPRGRTSNSVVHSGLCSRKTGSSASDTGERKSESDEEPPLELKYDMRGKRKVNEMENVLAKMRKFKRLKSPKRLSPFGSKIVKKVELNGMHPLDANNVEKLYDESGRVEDGVKKVASESDTDDECWQQTEECKRRSERLEKNEPSADSIDDWRGDEWESENVSNDDGSDEEVGTADITQAKFVLRNITSRVPLIEETAICRGVKLSGPPLEFATTHLDEYARKFRWPQHVRNLRTTKFSQDPAEILEDYEVLADLRQSDQSAFEPRQKSPFAQVPRPMLALAAKALRRLSRKRKRVSHSEQREERTLSTTTLLNIARAGSKFGDHFIESLLSANGKALQGIEDYDFVYDNRCWSSLPTKKKPIANWRFVFEHLQKSMGTLESDIACCPPLKQITLLRIKKRLKKLYGFTTQHAEHDVFADPPAQTVQHAKDPTE